MEIYFDNAATTPVSDRAKAAYISALELMGNPSSVHSAGSAARRALEDARATVASAAGFKAEELYFTASGTEANNTAIFGIAERKAKQSRRVVLTDSEHPSVMECAKKIERDGGEAVLIPTVGGAVDTAALEKALKEKTALVCVMAVNNETGAIYDLKAVRSIIDKSGSGALLHCDAVQGFMKAKGIKRLIRLADTVAFSAHKLHAPRGVGALAVKSGLHLPPYLYGGGQERGMRSGTENVAGAAAFAAAVNDYTEDKLLAVSAVREHIIQSLTKAGNVGFNVPKEHIDGILNISLYGIKSETALNCLSAEGIYISASSACSARKGVSSVLSAYGLEKNALDSALRIGISPYNTVEEADILCEALIRARERYGRI